MKIIGLTGGIASGKNFVADIFKSKGAAIFDADFEVHKLLESDQNIIAEVSNAFPGSCIDAKIDRKILGKIVFQNKDKLQILEDIIHPIIRQEYYKFLERSESEGRELVLLNIPLLLEKKGYECDKIIAITIDPEIQKERFLERFKKSNNSDFTDLDERFNKITASQMSNSQRESLADFVIDNSGSREEFINQIEDLLIKISVFKK